MPAGPQCPDSTTIRFWLTNILRNLPQQFWQIMSQLRTAVMNQSNV